MNITKRIISTTLCFIMLLSALSLIGITVSAEGTLYYGDINKNGKVEASDARLILRASASLVTLNAEQKLIADCNTDGKISAADARKALRAAAKLETPVSYTPDKPSPSVDFTKLYIEQLKKDDCILTHNNVQYYYIGAAICKMISGSENPQLAVAYHTKIEGWVTDCADVFLLRIYDCKNGKVSLVAEHVTEEFAEKDLFIWKNPETNLFAFAMTDTMSEAFSLYSCDILSSQKEKEIMSLNCWNPTPTYYNNYNKLFKTQTDYIDLIAMHFGAPTSIYPVYNFETFQVMYEHPQYTTYTYPRLINLNIIDNNGKIEILTSSF